LARLQDAFATEIQALGPDIVEAAEYAKTMSAEDVDEMIDHILVEVGLFVSYCDRTTTDKSTNSMARTLLVSLSAEESVPALTISQNFPPRVLEACTRYKYDEELRNDPIEYQRIYQELRVEAALVLVVSFSFS